MRIRPYTVVGWQLPYLRVALILRRVSSAPRDGTERVATARELANLERIRAEVERAGWFN